MTLDEFFAAIRSGATLHRDDSGASTWLAIEHAGGRRETAPPDLAESLRFQRLYRDRYAPRDLVLVFLRNVPIPDLVLAPVAWDGSGHQVAYRETGAEVERLRGLVARLVDVEPIEWRGIASDEPYCLWCGQPLFYGDVIGHEEALSAAENPASHKPDCPWVEGRAPAGGGG